VLSLGDRFRRGDIEVMDELIDELTPRLITVARAFCSDLDEAHDIVQETWSRVFRKHHQFRGSGSPLPWILTICRNESRRLLGLRARNHVEIDDNIPSPADEESMALQRIEADRVRRIVADNIHLLRPREGEAVLLLMLKGASTRESAEIMGIDESSVRAYLSRGLATLRDCIEGRGAA